MKNKKYYQIDLNSESKIADIFIYGEITSWPWLNSDVSAYNIVKEIDSLDVDEINVYINSPGGEVAEAVAIYSALKRSKAKVTTFCDGFACSAASIIFCAGEERVIGKLAMLMIHNAMSYVGYANADELRKVADDTEKINKSSIEAYKSVCSLSEDEITRLMNEETWLTADEALNYGFATQIAEEPEETGAIQSVQPIIHKALASRQKAKQNDLTSNAIESINKFISFVSKIEQIDFEKDKNLSISFSNFLKFITKE